MNYTGQLPPRRRRFVEEYLVDFNGAQAAIRAGYAIASAKVTASRLLTDDNVSSAIARRQKRLASRVEVTAERALNELAALAFANMADFIEVGEDGMTRLKPDALQDRRLAAAISQVDVATNDKGETRMHIKLANKLAALVELIQRLELPHPATGRAEIEDENIDRRKLAMAILSMLRKARMEEDAQREHPKLAYTPGP